MRGSQAWRQGSIRKLQINSNSVLNQQILWFVLHLLGKSNSRTCGSFGAEVTRYYVFRGPGDKL